MRAPRSAGAPLDALVVAALVLLSLARWGNAVEEVCLYLPYIRSLAGTWPAPTDRHIEGLRHMPVWWCHVAALFEARGCLFEALLAAVVLGRVALACAAVALGAAISGRRPVRYAGAFLCVLALPYGLDPARFVLLHAEALPALVATPLSIGALVLAARRRPLLGGVLLGLAANLHAVVALDAVPAFLVALWVGEPLRRASACLRGLLAAGTLALPTALTVVGQALAAGPREAGLSTLLRKTNGSHLFFSGFDSGTWAAFLVLAATALVVLHARSRRRRALAAAGLAGLLVAALGLALAEIDAASGLLALHAGRAAVPTKAIVLAFAGALAWRRSRALDAGAVGAALLVAGILESTCVAGLGAAVLAVLALGESRPLVGYPALALAASGAVLAPREGVLPALVLALLFLVAARAGRTRGRGALALGAVLASVLVHHVVIGASEQGFGVSLRWASLGAAPHGRGAAERRDLGAFLASATPTDARLLAPPEERLLPYLAGRRVVAAAQWATFAPWDPRGGKLEVAALEAIGYRFDDRAREQAYHAWGPTRILETARSLGASHVVIDRTLGDPALGTPIFENARYRVYAVR